MIISHKQWNIQCVAFREDELIGLNEKQSKSMSIYINDMAKRLDEAEFLLAAHENRWKIPLIENDYEIKWMGKVEV